MLTSEQAHALVIHIRKQEEPREAVNPEAVHLLLRRPNNPNGLWRAIAAGEQASWAGTWQSLETTAALLYELAGSCAGAPDGKHALAPLASNRSDACRYCGVSGGVVRSLQAWEVQSGLPAPREPGESDRAEPART